MLRHTTEQALELLQAAVAVLRDGPSTDTFPREKVAKLVERACARFLSTAEAEHRAFVAGILACNELLDDALNLAHAQTQQAPYQVQAMSAIERSQAMLYFVAFRNEPGAPVPTPLSLRPSSLRPSSRPPEVEVIELEASPTSAPPGMSLADCGVDELELLLRGSQVEPARESDGPELQLASLEPGAFERELHGTLPPPQAAEPSLPPRELAAGKPAQLWLKTEVTFEGPTNFYLGFQDDISGGGLFLATYNRQVIGTQVALSFALPGGHIVETTGSVRWVRDVVDPDEDSTPGFGVAFDALRPEDLEAIHDFIRIRAPMFYDDES